MKCAHALAYSIFLPKTLRNTRNSCLYLILYIMADLFDVRREIMDNLLNVDDEDLIEEEIQLFLNSLLEDNNNNSEEYDTPEKEKDTYLITKINGYVIKGVDLQEII